VRVLFDGHHLGRRQTGNESYTRGLLRGLLGRPSVELVVAVDRGADVGGLDVAPDAIEELPRAAPLRLPLLGLASRRRRADVVHSIYYVPPLARHPIVVSIHDVSFLHYPQFFSRRELVKNRIAIGWAARHADLVLALTDHAREELLRAYGLDPLRVRVVPAGVRETFLAAGTSRAASGHDDGPVRVLAVGAIQPRKNLIRLAAALRRVATSYPVSLRIIGPEGHAAARIRAELRESQVSVETVGWVTEDVLIHEYLEADVFAYPSIYEGFGIPVIEAMACGTPVVTSTGGSLPEVAGDAALLVDPYDVEGIAAAITQVAGDPALRDELAQRGRARAAQYSWATAVDRLIDAYTYALQSKA
jgi:glycosyltransferase involved in cell wall biosynthesis